MEIKNPCTKIAHFSNDLDAIFFLLFFFDKFVLFSCEKNMFCVFFFKSEQLFLAANKWK